MSKDQPNTSADKTPANHAGDCVRSYHTMLRLGDGYESSVTVYELRNCSGLPVVYLHGIQSHPGWFGESAQVLASAGHAVYMPARRGSGLNSQARGHAKSAGQLLADVESAVRYALEQTGARAAHIIGVSWGGKLAAAYAAWRGRKCELASLTMVAPGIAPVVDMPVADKLRVVGRALVGSRRGIAIPLNEPELFTDNPARRQFIADDPLRLREATASFYVASRKLDVMLRLCRRGCIALPATLLLASRDRIIDNARTTAVVGRLTAGRAAVRVLEGAHTLEFEQEPGSFHGALLGSLVGR